MKRKLHFQYWSVGDHEVTIFLKSENEYPPKIFIRGFVEEGTEKEILNLLETICERYNNDLEINN